MECGKDLGGLSKGKSQIKDNIAHNWMVSRQGTQKRLSLIFQAVKERKEGLYFQTCKILSMYLYNKVILTIWLCDSYLNYPMRPTRLTSCKSSILFQRQKFQEWSLSLKEFCYLQSIWQKFCCNTRSKEMMR